MPRRSRGRCSSATSATSRGVRCRPSRVASSVTVLIVTHNLNLAARYADQLVLLDRGRVARSGPPAEVLGKELVELVYRWPVRITPHPGPGPDAGAPQVTPLTNQRDS